MQQDDSRNVKSVETDGLVRIKKRTLIEWWFCVLSYGFRVGGGRAFTCEQFIAHQREIWETSLPLPLLTPNIISSNDHSSGGISKPVIRITQSFPAHGDAKRSHFCSRTCVNFHFRTSHFLLFLPHLGRPIADLTCENNSLPFGCLRLNWDRRQARRS